MEKCLIRKKNVKPEKKNRLHSIPWNYFSTLLFHSVHAIQQQYLCLQSLIRKFFFYVRLTFILNVLKDYEHFNFQT